MALGGWETLAVDAAARGRDEQLRAFWRMERGVVWCVCSFVWWEWNYKAIRNGGEEEGGWLIGWLVKIKYGRRRKRKRNRRRHRRRRLEGEIIQSQMGLASLTVSQGSAAQPV
jgi:hypothetical protein